MQNAGQTTVSLIQTQPTHTTIEETGEETHCQQSPTERPILCSKETSTNCLITALRKTIQQKLRHMQDSWLIKKADEIQEYADKNDMKNFYSGLKEIYGPTTSGSSPILNKDGTNLITDKEDILKRWAEHFDSVLNRPSAINDEAIN